MNLKNTPRAAEFVEILGIIHSGRSEAFEAVNVALNHWDEAQLHQLLVASSMNTSNVQGSPRCSNQRCSLPSI